MGNGLLSLCGTSSTSASSYRYSKIEVYCNDFHLGIANMKSAVTTSEFKSALAICQEAWNDHIIVDTYDIHIQQLRKVTLGRYYTDLHQRFASSELQSIQSRHIDNTGANRRSYCTEFNYIYRLISYIFQLKSLSPKQVYSSLNY
jgi:hypothetical protein